MQGGSLSWGLGWVVAPNTSTSSVFLPWGGPHRGPGRSAHGYEAPGWIQVETFEGAGDTVQRLAYHPVGKALVQAGSAQGHGWLCGKGPLMPSGPEREEAHPEAARSENLLLLPETAFSG